MMLKDLAEVIVDDIEIYDRNSQKDLFVGNDMDKKFDEAIEKYGYSPVASIEPTTFVNPQGLHLGRIIIEIYAEE